MYAHGLPGLTWSFKSKIDCPAGISTNPAIERTVYLVYMNSTYSLPMVNESARAVL